MASSTQQGILKLLTSKAAVEQAMREFIALGREEFLQRYDYGKAKSYWVIEPTTGEPCDSKAIAGVAIGIQHPSRPMPKADDFSGGDKTVAAVLEGLGFEVKRGGQDWNETENDAVVHAYFEMLTSESLDLPYVKAKYKRKVGEIATGRSRQSIDYKLANISALLDKRGLPYLSGFRPRDNAQAILKSAIDRYIAANTAEVEATFARLLGKDTTSETPDPARRVDPPRSVRRSQSVQRDSSLGVREPRKIDYLERQKQNTALGRSGEEWILKSERRRLIDAGRPDLADSVEWSSEVRGDGLGYDIRSFETDGNELFIEVKTTNEGATAAFFVSAAEVEASREIGEAYALYRLFRFSTDPHFFVLRGPLDQHVELTPTLFRAGLLGS